MIANSGYAQTEQKALFEDALIVGTVFDDQNENGIQDNGEQGIPGVRIISPDGLVIITDHNGEYHLKGVYGGKSSRGFNSLLKVDPSSLPQPHRFVSPNPLLKRVTAGLVVRFDFAVKLPKKMTLEVSDVIFVRNSHKIHPKYRPLLAKIASKIKDNRVTTLSILSNLNSPLNQSREAELLNELSEYLPKPYSLLVTTQIKLQ